MGEFGWMRFIVAAIIGLMIHLVTAFVNDVVDIDTDERNKSRSIFSGGSGVIVEGKLTRAQLQNAATVAAICAVLLTAALVFYLGVHWAIFLLMAWGLVSGAGYSLPPLRIAYRGGGEFLVMITYSLPLVWAGYIIQAGPVPSILPWILSVPIAFAVFSLITITQFPDQDADRIAKKRSLVILLGEQRTLKLVALGIVLSMLGALSLFTVKSLPAWAGGLSLLCLPFALDALRTIYRHEPGEAAWMRLCRNTIMLTLVLGLAPTCGMLLGHWLA